MDAKRGFRIAGIFLILFSSILEIGQNIWKHFRTNLGSTVTYIGEVYAAVKEQYKEFFYTLEEALKVILPQAGEIKEEVKSLSAEQKKAVEQKASVKFNPEYDKEFHWYKGISEDKTVGYAYVDVVPGKWGPIKYMIGLTPEGKVTDIVVMALSERRGRPIKERRFLNQYPGKTINDPLKLKKDIKGIAGATISSRGVTEGIRKVIYVFKEIYQK